MRPGTPARCGARPCRSGPEPLGAPPCDAPPCDALIGSTGFVGGSLLMQRRFGAQYHSADIEGIAGRRFGRVVCAGVTAVKWWANANAAADLAGIRRLMACLDRVEADSFVLISTVDVYADPQGVTEDDPMPVPSLHRDSLHPGGLHPGGLQPYGRHRAMLEGWVRTRFPRHHVIRLPALFGPGLKKNAVFDLLHGNRLAFIDPASRFQWYPLSRLADDIDRAQAVGLPLVNLVTEPVPMAAIQERLFPGQKLGGQAQPVAYDVRTRHGPVFGGDGNYAMTAAEVMAALQAFVAEAQAARHPA